MNRIDIINHYVKKTKAKKYLEIGVRGADCFNSITCEYKVGVDPDKSSGATIFETSDDFFAKNTEKFDVCFVDGMHHDDFVYRDITNALNCLNDGGVILCHDMHPTSEFIQLIPQRPDHCEWCGNCWQAWVKLRQERDDLEMFVSPYDWGTAVIKRGKQEKLKIDVPITYQNFEIHKKEWLNLLTEEEFKKKLEE